MTRCLPFLIVPVLFAGCPWIPEDVHDQFNGDDDDDSEIVDNDTDCEDIVLYADRDGDGWGGERVDGCDPPRVTATDEGDCNDNDEAIRPDAVEICDGVDNGCNVGTPEVGLATMRNPLTNERFDVTSSFTAGQSLGTGTDWLEAEINFCTGTYNASLTVLEDDPVVTLRGIGDVTLQASDANRGLVVQDGTLIVENITLIGGTATDGGGGILCVNGDLTLTDVSLGETDAPAGGALYGSTCDTDLRRVTLADANGEAGSYIYADNSDIDVTDSGFDTSTGNEAVVLNNTVLRMNNSSIAYGGRTGINVSDNGQFDATSVDFPNTVGTDVLAGTNSYNLGPNYSGFCNANGCTGN